ncbi:PH domain-containing protein [Acidobacteriota bacterium]
MEFILPAPKLLLYLGIGLIMLGILVFFGVIKGRKSELSRKIGAVITIIIGIILFLQKNSGKIIVEEDQFTLKALYFKTLSIKIDNIQKIWIQDLQNSEWKPVKRKAGTSLEGISSGRFSLQNGQSAFVVLDGYRALCIETKDGHLALFGVEEFDEFIDKIKSFMPHIQI